MQPFVEEHPEAVKDIERILRHYKSGKSDIKQTAMYLYMKMDMFAREQVGQRNHEDRYYAAGQVNDLAIRLYDELGEYNIARQFQEYLFTKLAATTKEG